MDEFTQPASHASTKAADAIGDLSGQKVGDFQILRRIGRGGMGHVYLAEQLSLKRKVALKFLKPELASNPTALSRFRREAEAVARLTHANIVQVYAIGDADGRHYMALEYVEGRNLREYVARKGPPDLPVIQTVIKQVAAALQRAAEHGIVHRDIKPENILLTRKGEVKVADFGLSRDLAGDQELSLTQSGVALGTPLYMSPEQVQGKPLDPRSDIYSFGVTCYYMLAGRPPFRGRTAVEVALKHINEEAPSLSALRPDLPPHICALVHRMMDKNPAARPQSGREVLRDINLQGGPAESDNPFADMTIVQPSTPRATSPSGETTAQESWSGEKEQKRFPWIAAIVAASILVAFAAGAGIRAWKNAHAASSMPAIDDHPNLPVVSDQERRLLAAIESFTTPKQADKIRLGAGLHVELAVLYWQQKRYNDAENLFNEMIKRSGAPPAYRTLGQIGLAITYALRDEVERSNKTFMDAKTVNAAGKVVLPQIALPTEDQINLRFWAGTALDRNATRPPMPKELEELRRDLRRTRPNPIAG